MENSNRQGNKNRIKNMKTTTQISKRMSTMAKVVLVMVVVAMGVRAYAVPVDAERAKRVAKGFWKENPKCGDPKAMEEKSMDAGMGNVYVIAVNGNEGFVMVSADDRVRPVLGYGFGAVPNTAMRENVKGWIDWYGEQIESIKNSDYEAPEEVSAEWAHLETVTTKRAAGKSVNHLLSTQWDQSPLYNNMCPYDASAGSRAVTGCTATATAQVMKYWNHPSVGQGSHSYSENDYGTLSADFGNTQYDWDHMPNQLTYSSSETEIAAVAQLMYHVGVAVEMDYSVEGSGAYTISYDGWIDACSEVALVRYFDYKSTTQGIMRDYYTDSEWQAIIKNELDNARPIIYTGDDPSGGHAFVCDGYDDQMYFHMNWGWSGALDGYFLLDSLTLSWGGTGTNDSFSFNDSQTAIIGLEPNADELRVAPTEFTNVPASGAELSVSVRSSSEATGWSASSDVAWVSITPTSGNGGGAVGQMTITVAENPTENMRTAHITVVQGNESKVISVTQRDALGLANGWVGNNVELWPMDHETGDMVIICSDRWGTYRATDKVTKVKFTTYQENGSSEYNNNSFDIKIYRNPMSVENIPSMQSNLYAQNSESYWGEVAYEQHYEQTGPGVQIVELAEPYTIGNETFWIGVSCGGKTRIMYNYIDVYPNRMDLNEYPNVEWALEKYRYLYLNDYSGTKYLNISYIVFCDNDDCDTVVQGNVDYALSFYVESSTTGIEDKGMTPEIKVYPNPARGTITVEGEGIRNIEMSDLTGRKVAEWGNGGRLNLNNIGRGVYFVRITTDKGTTMKRVVVE